MNHEPTICSIPLAQLIGPDGLPRTADGKQRTFNPALWRRTVGPFDINKVGIIKVIEHLGRLDIADGQHRVHALIAHGYTSTFCEVVSSNEISAGEAFLGANAGVIVTWHDKWRVMRLEGISPVPEIENILGRHGYTVGNSGAGARYQFTCYSSLMHAYAIGALDHALEMFDQLGGELCEGWVLDTVVAFLGRHPEASAKRMGAKLREFGLDRFKILARQSLTRNQGRRYASYMAFVEIYNSRLRVGRLVPTSGAPVYPRTA